MPPQPESPAPEETVHQHTEAVLDAAVESMGGAQRPGQHRMAQAITASVQESEHLLVQAGTGTGKSLGYLAPSLVALAHGDLDRVVVATATLALQAQLAYKDIPLALDAVASVTGKRPTAALLKGRTNYVCLHRARGGGHGPSAQEVLISGEDLLDTLTASETDGAPDAEGPSSRLGAEVVMLREWAEKNLADGGSGDRDDAPPHSERAWSQMSVPVRECLGAQQCPFGSECFVEKSREKARSADLVVTNHALLAIDAMHGGTALPAHDVVIVDEAHELVSRMTGAASVELSPALIERVGRRAMTWLEDELALDFLESADLLRQALDAVPPERITSPSSAVVAAAESIRVTTRAAVSALGGSEDPDQRQAHAAVKEVFDIAERVAGLADADVVYVSESERLGRMVHVAPLSVAGLLRQRVLQERTTIFCSATLRIGGNFHGVAASFGLTAADCLGEEGVHDSTRESARGVAEAELAKGLPSGTTTAGSGETNPEDDFSSTADGPAASKRSEGEQHSTGWRGLDVGSPFDYRRQGIMYVARHLPPPGRDGLPPEVLAEIAELTWAAGGRTLGLFASRRNAEAAAKFVRKELPKSTILCQGDAQLTELTKRFLAEPETSLFGTLSLWQGVDIPGDTCRLVIMDKIPFPRPDDPLMKARQETVAAAGGNGFMAVAAAHAALLLAQGSGRLIRTVEDRGVVAVLDPRLVTARYGEFLRAGMPDFWQTVDREKAIGALQRLAEAVP